MSSRLFLFASLLVCSAALSSLPCQASPATKIAPAPSAAGRKPALSRKPVPPRKPARATAGQPGADAAFDTPALSLLRSAPSASAFPNAGSITLRDETRVRLNADGTSQQVVYETSKIFNQRGRARADVTFPFNASTQQVSNLHARTIQPDGKVLLVKPEEIHEGSPYSAYTMYDDAKTVGFSMPGIEDGAIVDYTYTLTTRRAMLPGQFFENWYFQGDLEPVRLSRYVLVAPAAVTLQSQIHNALGLTPQITASGDTKTYVWEMRDVPDVMAEPMMPPAQMFTPWLQVSTVPSWQTVAEWYQHLAAPRMTASPEIKDLVQQLIAGKTSDTEKARALFYWVEGKTRYVALELGLSAYQPHSAIDVCQNRYGDCKDMATLLITMLHVAGIKTAWPVLLQAGNKLPVHDLLATPGAFDHAIVRADIDGKPYWFDSTAELCSFGQIPGADRGVDALVIRDGVGKFETIPVGTPADNLMAMTEQVTLHADGSAECRMKTDTAGDTALSSRFRFRSVKPDQMREGFTSMVRALSSNASLQDFSLSPFEDRDKPMAFGCTFHAPLWATKTANLLIVPGNDASSSVYSHEGRRFPIYQTKSDKQVYDIVITLPPGYTVEAKPEDVHQHTSLNDYDVTYTLSGDTLIEHTVVQSSPAIVPAAEYPRLKAQYETLAPLLKQPIVLRKVKTASP